MKYFTLLLTLVGFLLLSSCQSDAAKSTDDPTAERKVEDEAPAVEIPAHDKMTKFIYADRSGNTFEITADSIKYNPVTVILSSTGQYSGGDPLRLGMSSNQFKVFTDLIDQAFSDPGSHIEKRLKNSGMLAVFKPGQKRNKIILAPDSAPQLAIEKKLKEWIGKTED